MYNSSTPCRKTLCPDSNLLTTKQQCYQLAPLHSPHQSIIYSSWTFNHNQNFFPSYILEKNFSRNNRFVSLTEQSFWLARLKVLCWISVGYFVNTMCLIKYIRYLRGEKYVQKTLKVWGALVSNMIQYWVNVFQTRN